MRALENVATAHVNLADSYFDLGARYLERARSGSARLPAPGTEPQPEPGQIAARFYGLALDEYREALKRDPTSATALIQFSRVFWEWRQAAADRAVPREPGLSLAREAEWYARRAVAMVEAKLDSPSRGLIVADRSEEAQKTLVASVPANLRPPAATALASLGSVLLGQARAHEALGVLGSAQALAPEHPAFDDVRWMLGQALLCAASRQWRADLSQEVRQGDPNWRETHRPQLDAIEGLRQEAAAALDRVRDSERAREGRPFAGRTDTAGALNVCHVDWLTTMSEQQGQMRYSLKQTQGQGPQLPVREARRPRAEAAEGEERAYLRVWGGGAERLRLESRGEGGRGSDVVSLALTTSRYYYLAQLEGEDGRPLSPPLALDPNATPARAPSASAARCADPRTLITLAVGAARGARAGDARAAAGPATARRRRAAATASGVPGTVGALSATLGRIGGRST